MTDPQVAVVFFLEIACILIVCRGVGWLAARAGQPQVVAEMVAGFLIGPSFFGWLAPAAHAQLFPPAAMRVIFVVSQVALVLYMFCVGLEFRSDLLVRNVRRAAAVSVAGIAAPFTLGGALALVMFGHGGLFTPAVTTFHAVLFVGAAMSITAFPMLARIIYERGIAGTSLGTLALSAGAIDDAAAWIILAIVLGSFTGSATLALFAAGGGLLYVAVVFGVIRPLFGRVGRAAEEHGALTPWMMPTVLATLAFGAWFTDVVGIYSVFGAFMLGVSMPRGLLTRELQRLIEPLTTSLLVPLFFVYAGLNTQLALVNSLWLWAMTGLVFVVACAGKGVACWAAARLSGATQRDALGLATLMNARGMMELILLNIGLQRGLITSTLYTILVLMTIGTTLMAGPLFSRVWVREAADSESSPLSTLETF